MHRSSVRPHRCLPHLLWVDEAPASQEGSAYVVTVTALLVLSLLGLSLSLTTHTESLMGSQERLIQRLFYAADSGLGVATAKVLVENDTRPQVFAMVETRTFPGLGSLTLEDTVKTTSFVPILQSPCHLCQINQGRDFFAVLSSVGVEAVRVGRSPTDDEAVPLGRKRLGVMVSLQPWVMGLEAFTTRAGDDSFASETYP